MVDDAVGGTSAVKVAFGITLIVFMFIGIIFHSAVLHTFRKTNQLQTPTNILIIGCIVCDLMILILGVPYITASCFHGNWIFGSAWCQGYAFIMTLLVVTTVCILTAISLNRYFVIMKSPLAAKITTYKAGMTILSCFGYGLLWATFPLVGWGGYVVENGNVSCGPHWTNKMLTSNSYNICIFVLVFLVPVCIIAFCYANIFLEVRYNRVQTIDRPAEQIDIANTPVRTGEVHVAACLFTLSFLVAWTPYITMSVWTMVNDNTNISENIAVFALALAKSACIWKTVIYVLIDKSFRDSFYEQVLKCQT